VLHSPLSLSSPPTPAAPAVAHAGFESHANYYQAAPLNVYAWKNLSIGGGYCGMLFLSRCRACSCASEAPMLLLVHPALSGLALALAWQVAAP